MDPAAKLAASVHDSFLRIKDARTELETKGDSHTNPSSWKLQYKEFREASKYNIAGSNWFAIYGGHGLERIQVMQKGYKITTKKLKGMTSPPLGPSLVTKLFNHAGDVNVPTGKPTFEISLRRNGKCGVGRIHLAMTGYVNPHWGFCSLEIDSPDRFYVHWYLSPTEVYTKRFWIENNETIRRSLSHEV